MQGMFVCISRGLAIKLILFSKGVGGEAVLLPNQIYGEKIYVNQLSGEAKVNGDDNKPVRIIINIERGSQK